MKAALNFSKTFLLMREKKIIKCDCEDDIPPLEEQFHDIMENFDFKHVQMMMDWDKSRVIYNDDGSHSDYQQWMLWQGGGWANLKVPSILELRKDAERLLKSVIMFAKANRRSKFYMTATGPFKATYRYGIIELECIFTSWSCD